MVTATTLMNANSVPRSNKVEFETAARRLAIFLHHVEMLPSDIEVARNGFFASLHPQWASILAAGLKPDLEYVAYDDGLGYTSRLYGMLYELKAFLDIFARFVCRQISGKPAPNGFNKGKVDQDEISGGRVINWVNGHTLEAMPSRDSLASLLTAASIEWITDAVTKRDTLVHYRDLPGLIHMRVPVSGGPPNLEVSDILLPEMPDGTNLRTFAESIRDALCNLVSEVLPLLPYVNASMNRKWQSLS